MNYNSFQIYKFVNIVHYSYLFPDEDDGADGLEFGELTIRVGREGVLRMDLTLELLIPPRMGLKKLVAVNAWAPREGGISPMTPAGLMSVRTLSPSTEESGTGFNVD